MKKSLVVIMLIILPVTALHAMTVAVFLQKADALEQRGMMALFSSDARLLKAEVKNAGQALNVEREAAQRAGRRAAYCPPAEGARTDSKTLFEFFRSFPAEQRERMEVKDGLRLWLSRRYPCPA